MEINMKNIVLFLAVITTAMSAGLFYAWTISVVPGLKNIPTKSYLEALQSMNRAILNPGFFVIFFGSLVLMILSVYFQFRVQINLTFWLIVAGSIFYLIGTVGVTIFGNVPLNETLDGANINVLNPDDLENLRASIESKWNRLNIVRTIFSVLAFIILLLGILSNGTDAIKN